MESLKKWLVIFFFWGFIFTENDKSPGNVEHLKGNIYHNTVPVFKIKCYVRQGDTLSPNSCVLFFKFIIANLLLNAKLKKKQEFKV